MPSAGGFFFLSFYSGLAIAVGELRAAGSSVRPMHADTRDRKSREKRSVSGSPGIRRTAHSHTLLQSGAELSNFPRTF